MLSMNDKQKLEIVGQKFRAAKAPYHMMVDSLLNEDSTLLYMACLHDDGRITPDEKELLDWFKLFSARASKLVMSDQREMINCAFHGYYKNPSETEIVAWDSQERDANVSVA